jgi:hypothetical protein
VSVRARACARAWVCVCPRACKCLCVAGPMLRTGSGLPHGTPFRAPGYHNVPQSTVWYPTVSPGHPRRYNCLNSSAVRSLNLFGAKRALPVLPSCALQFARRTLSMFPSLFCAVHVELPAVCGCACGRSYWATHLHAPHVRVEHLPAVAQLVCRRVRLSWHATRSG